MRRKFLFILANLLMRTLTRVEPVRGAENLPSTGAAVLAFNHLGRLDAAMIFILRDRKDFTGWVADKYQKIPFIPTLVKWLDGEWVDREGVDLKAIKWAVAWLKDGHMLGIAPEGTRSLTGALIEARQGVAYLAARTGVPIVPVAITGTESVSTTWRRLRRPRLTIRLGEPFYLPKLQRSTRTQSLQDGTDEIMCRIAALLPPKYHGIYAQHPRLKALLAMDAN